MSNIKKEIEDELYGLVKETKATDSSKLKFISEIKNGLGEEIKNNPNKVRVIKKTNFEKLKGLIKKALTIF